MSKQEKKPLPAVNEMDDFIKKETSVNVPQVKVGKEAEEKKESEQTPEQQAEDVYRSNVLGLRDDGIYRTELLARFDFLNHNLGLINKELVGLSGDRNEKAKE